MDGFDNRESNLREISAGANTVNRPKQKSVYSSDFFGVSLSRGKWVGSISKQYKSYSKAFDNEIDAAIFRDMHALALYKIMLCNNSVLTDEQTNDILERGFDAIPEKYKINKKQRDVKVKINKEIWEKFALMKWNINQKGYVMGYYNGTTISLHILVYREYYPDYDVSLHGTVDHRNRCPADCTIENLRSATYSQQSQNRESHNISGYKGVTLREGCFRAHFQWEGKHYYFKKQRYLEDAARDYNTIAISKWSGALLNEIPDTKTCMGIYITKAN